ncbi:Uncharacterised protein [Mycobacteroides abscessus subsp. abscessus]|nr:Uncharacterised protein [Mycobacteroides abscessus subsp. abscessus]
MTGAIIILIRSTNSVPSGASETPTPGASQPTRMPAATATSTARYNQWVRSRRRVGVGSLIVVSSQ